MRKKLFGRHPLTLGAVILLGLSLYELWVRMEDFQAWILGLKHLSEVRGTSFLEDLGIVFQVPEMRQMGFKMLYLAAVIIFAVICLLCRNRSRGMWVILLLAAAAAVTGVLLEFYALAGLLQILKLIPLAMIAAGSITNLVQRQSNYRKGKYPSSLPDNRPLPPRRY